MMRRRSLNILVLVLIAHPAMSQDTVKIDDTNSASIPLASAGGWVLRPDGETLIVSSPTTAELVYINTSEDKEIKRVKVDFQPAALALRGASLFAVAKGASMLYVLDAETGKVKKEIRVPGAKLSSLACHPANGPLFATNESYQVLAINTELGKVSKTPAEGNFLAVDPVRGDYLYTGTQKPMRDSLVLSRGPGNTVRVGVARSIRNSTVVKYAVKPKELKPMGVLGNAAINGREVAVSRDGKKLAVVGAGGFQGEDGKRSYSIGIFDAADLNTQLGQVETGAFPAGVAFHPALDIGVAEKSGGTLCLFNARSFTIDKTIEVSAKGPANPQSGVLLFGGRGTKLVYYLGGGNTPARAARARSAKAPAKQAGLYLIPHELTDEQKADLAKAFPAAKG